MDCGTYIEKYLSAHVDGELSADELREAEEHIAGCVNCRARFAEERAVKALLRERAEMRRTPPMVRGSILAALDAIDNSRDASAASAGSADRAAGADRGRRLTRRAFWTGVPVAIAAVAVFAFILLHGGRGPTPAHAIPPFDLAIDHFEHFVDRFDPNAGTSPAELSGAYLDHQLPGFLWNFQHAGYQLKGGRIDRLADGESVAYTYYQGDAGSVLCTFMKAHGFQPPDGEVQELDGHHCYRYKGYTICLSYPPGGYICVLVSRRAMKDFMQDVALSEP